MRPSLHYILAMATTLLFALSACSPAQADSLPLDRVEGILEIGKQYGFASYQSIEAEDDDRFELEGWNASERRLEVEFDREGRVFEENIKRGSDRKRGLNDSEILQTVTIARDHGMVRFEEIELDDRDTIEIEGRTDTGAKLELQLDRQDFSILKMKMERD